MAVAIANQWASSFSQAASFQTTSPALQSVVVALNNSTSVGGGSGTPTAGNWLFTLVGMNEQSATAGFTVGVGDDVHSFWRPGDETASTWAVSTASGLTRAAAWYTANTARAPGNVYVAPNGAFDALTVLVVEVSGLGPWDTVAGISTNYAAAATSLSLALGAPSAQALIIGAVAGDLSTATQAFAPASWTGLHTVSVTNGTDHTCDSVLTSAYIVTSGSVSVSGTAVSATDLSGVLISVLTSAPSPVPATQNPNWPYVKYEMAFGGGFQDPQDTLTWTDLTNRLWSWNETTGIQYQLGQIQATELNLELDNFDGLLSSDNPASYFYTASGANWSPSSAFYDTLVAANSPLGWWKLADASGTTSPADSSGNSHTGTATAVTFGNASAAVTGNTSAAFASGSSSKVTTTYNPALTAVTVEAWVNLNGLSQSGNPALVANSNTASDHKGFVLGLSGTKPQAVFGNTSTSATVTAASALPATGWTHLAGTWDGTTVTLYVNGVSQGTAALAGTMPAGTGNIGLGFNSATSSAFINGLLAECAVYGTALSAAQVAAHYTAGPSVTGTPLRLRAAIGTIGGVAVNRWYVIQRNAEQWPQEVDPAYRRRVTATATDIWSVLSSSGPTPYRGEVTQDAPYAWWPMDDQPLAGGVFPSSLRNAARGNTNVLNVVLSPNGATAQNQYGVNGNAVTAPSLLPSIASEAFAANAGWMYGDPQSSPASYQTSNPVTSNPGSAAWQATGQLGNTGSYGFVLICNDAGFPPLSGGITVEGWFNYQFFGGSASATTGPGQVDIVICQQPYAALTLWELATGSNPVAILQLDLSGHLNFITYAGATPTSHSIYTASDMRSETWWHIAVTMTTTAWTVYVNGGVTAVVSGTAAGMTSAWTWLIANGDLGASGGSNAGTGLVHGGNASFSHLAVYPSRLPAWRILAHYCAAMTAFGIVPAPQAVSVTLSPGAAASNTTWAPDGSIETGTYSGGFGSSTVTYSAVATSVIGSYTSGPSAWATTVNYTQNTWAWVGWNGSAAQFNVYTATGHGTETLAAVVAGAGDSFSSGYGAGASGAGKCQVSGGTGASPPTSASALGDTVAQRLERILGYGSAAYPGRCIDPASLAVQAATDIGGQQVGANLTNIAQSDGGLLAVDNLGNLIYLQKSNLASQYSSPAWTLTPAAPPTAGAPLTAIPYSRDFQWLEDPQRVWNAILITPFSPDGASLADIVPSQSAQVNASQLQYGAQPNQRTSYLQSQTEMQNQANWIFEYFGQSQIRADNMTVDAAPYPAAFPLVFGVNVSDVITVANWQVGGGGYTDTFRVTRIRREIAFSGGDAEDSPRAAVTLQADWEPPSYWS